MNSSDLFCTHSTATPFEMAAPRVGFSSLPTELKANIMKLVSWQEENWAHRVCSLQKTERKLENQAHVGGLRAASLVCKEWNALTLPYIFHVSRTSCTRKPC